MEVNRKSLAEMGNAMLRHNTNTTMNFISVGWIFPSLFSPFQILIIFLPIAKIFSSDTAKIIGNRSICMEAVNRSPVAGRGFGLLLYSNCVPMPRSRWRGAVPVHSALLSVYNKAWLPASGYILSAAGFPVLPYSLEKQEDAQHQDVE